jgi:hypothetical protein
MFEWDKPPTGVGIISARMGSAEIRVQLRQAEDGSWSATSNDDIRVSGGTRDECVSNLRQRLGPEPTVTFEVVPRLAGVAEAAELMGWDKRRVITYVNRGSFPAPVQSLASGRVWLRDDVEAFARDWHARQDRRRRRQERRAAREAAADEP